MRFVAECTDCGAVVLPAAEITLLSRAGCCFDGRFECPVCQKVGAMSVDLPVVPALMAQGADLLTQEQVPVPALGPSDLVAFRRVLDDDGACRRFLEGLSD